MPLRTTDDQDRSVELRDAIDRTGYYPDVVIHSVSAAVAGQGIGQLAEELAGKKLDKVFAVVHDIL